MRVPFFQSFGAASVLTFAAVCGSVVTNLDRAQAASVTQPAATSAPVIISPSTAVAVANASFNFQIILADGQSGTYTATGLPAGLILDTKVGAISGSTSALGTFAVGLTATNANGTGTATLTLTVEPAAPPTFSGAPAATGQQGSPFSFQVLAADEVTSYAATGLPAGLVINTDSGLISGTPTVAGTFPVTLSATNYQGTTTSVLTLTINPLLPVVTLAVVNATANPVSGQVATMLLTRTGDTSQALAVTFSVKGSGQDGVDYEYLPLVKKFKAGKSTKQIKITALRSAGASAGDKKTVKLTLTPAADYLLGDSITGKVKIYYTP